MAKAHNKFCPVCGTENLCFDDAAKQEIIHNLLKDDDLKELKCEYYKIVDSCSKCGYASYDFDCGITDINKAIYKLNYVKFRMINNAIPNAGFTRSQQMTGTESYALIREFKNQPKKAAYAYKLAAEFLENDALHYISQHRVGNVVDNTCLEVFQKQMQHVNSLRRLSITFNQKALEGGDMMCLFVMIDTLIHLKEFVEAKYQLEQVKKLNAYDLLKYQPLIEKLIAKYERDLTEEEKRRDN